MTLIEFTHESATDLDVSGGKGASLARSARELPVPPGLIVTADSYLEFLEPLRPRIREVLDEVARGAVSDDDASALIQALISDADLPATWADDIAAALIAANLADDGLAVRSSGTMEDLPGAAFAGQHDTFLGVRGAEDVARAIQRCYASLWNAHAMKYRNRLGLDHLVANMAVVVQKMVDVSADEAAGVAFSIDPVRGDLSSVLINAAFGLGETVVGGEAEVDEYILTRDGEERTVTVAEKPAALVSSPAGGVTHVELSPAQAQRAALDEQGRRAVAQLAVRAEQFFGFPQDIEWGFSGGELYLLQSRPVTRVAARWTRDESAERFPNPVTPLTWDLVEAGFHASLNHSFALMGLPAFSDKWFAMRDSYIYGNQTAVELYGGRFPVSYFADAETLAASIPEIARRYGWVQELPVQWMRDLDVYLIGIGRLSHEPLDDKDLAGLWRHVQEINDLGTAYFLPNIAISLTQRMLYAGLLRLLAVGVGQENAQRVFDQLLAQTDTKTGQVNAELWALSRKIRATPGLLEWLDAAPSARGRMDEFREKFGDVAKALDVFLGHHGHRELDFDAYHPTWVEAPHIVVDQLRVLARSEPVEAATANQLRAVQAEAERQVLARTPEALRYFVQEVIRLARAYTALDDLEHYQTTRLTPPMRRGLRALGQRLVSLGALDNPDDVYFLRVETLDTAVRTGILDPLRGEAADLKAGYVAAQASEPEWVYGEVAASVETNADLSGTARSPGTVDGDVFVVTGPEDFAAFPSGAILVARTTNPAWTALFYQAAGVITESGGALSHGAVTARELGIPAVMSVRAAMTRLHNGQRVRLDGTRGTVVLI